VKAGLTIIPVSHVSDVIAHALVRAPEPVDWDEEAEEAARAARLARGADDDAAGRTAH
jgi:ATP-dependent Lon protease